ncbi:dentin sialophosphoprotein [Strongylocentrotus purpuratus]|uniref:Uncharacterized protein n=1 Tax=Strongylocentrotus purpuratus TaxID=7668 RepID=A0A7M7P277_STRPU|nr:dentin sialophosphoprotein [Strongylocentrotus purpuratus]
MSAEMSSLDLAYFCDVSENSGRQKQPPPDEDEAESGLTTALKVGAVGALGLIAIRCWCKQSAAPSTHTTWQSYQSVDNRTFRQNNFTLRQNNLTFRQNNRTVVINPQRQSDQYPYRNSYPPSNLSLPVCSSDHRVSQYKRNSTTSKLKSYYSSKDGYSSDESDPDQQSSQYKRNSTISRPKSYYSSKDGYSSDESDPDQQSSQYVDNRTFRQNNFTLRQNNLTFQQNNRTVVINPQRQSDQYPYRNSYPPSNLSLPVCSSDHRVSQYKRNSTTSKPKSYYSSKDGYSSDESDPDQQSSQYKRNSTISRPKSYYSSKDGYSSNESDPDQQSSQYKRNSTTSQSKSYHSSDTCPTPTNGHLNTSATALPHISKATRTPRMVIPPDESDPDQRSSQY